MKQDNSIHAIIAIILGLLFLIFAIPLGEASYFVIAILPIGMGSLFLLLDSRQNRTVNKMFPAEKRLQTGIQKTRQQALDYLHSKDNTETAVTTSTGSILAEKSNTEILVECISCYEEDTSVMNEFWLEDGIEDAEEILNEFWDEDWDDLIRALPGLTVTWKKRIAFCLYDKDSPYHLIVLQELVKTNDKELFVLALHFMNRFDSIPAESQNTIREKIEKFMPESTSLDRITYDRFLSKFGDGKNSNGLSPSSDVEN